MTTTFVIGTLVVLRLAMTGADPVWTVRLPTSECGPNHGYAACHPGECCSKYGWCGLTDQHCNAESLWVGSEIKRLRGVTTPKSEQASTSVDPLLRTFYGITLPKHPELEGDIPVDYPSAVSKETAEQSAGAAEPVDTPTEATPSVSNTNTGGERGRMQVLDRSGLHRRPFVPGMNWCGHHKVVALTFDDGPLSGGYTAAVLDDLSQLDMKATATFFLSPRGTSAPGNRDPEEQCALLRRMLDEGHTVAGHSMTHVDFSKISYDAIKKEIDEYNAWYKGCVGFEPEFQALRPPFGNLQPHQRDYINSLGVSVVTWNADSDDWRGGDTQTIYQRTVERSRSLPQGGSIMVLHHDLHYVWGRGRGTLRMYRDYFRNLGYQFVNLNQCTALCASTNDCKMPGDTWPGVYDH